MRDTTILESIQDPELVSRMASRRDVLMEGGRAASVLAMASVPVALAALARSAVAQGSSLPQAIVDVLNFALTLEYLEDEFYRTGLAAANLVPATDRPVFAQISKHETAHVAFLLSVLGSAAVAKPTFDFTGGGAFPTVFTSYPTFQAVSQAFEDTGVRAYKGQAGNLISNDTILTAALQIHSVEARHASEVRRLRGQKGWITGNATDVPAIAAVYAGEENTTHAGVTLPATPAVTEAFDEPLTRAQVLAIVDPFIV